jgi:hypothetical protein
MMTDIKALHNNSIKNGDLLISSKDPELEEGTVIVTGRDAHGNKVRGCRKVPVATPQTHPLCMTCLKTGCELQDGVTKCQGFILAHKGNMIDKEI